MVLKKKNWPWPLYILTRQHPTPRNINDRLTSIFSQSFDSLILPLFTDQYLLQNPTPNLDFSTLPSDQHITNREYVKNIFIQINKVVDLSHKRWRKVFKFLVGYAVYLGTFAVVVHLPEGGDVGQWVRYMVKYSERDLFGDLHVILVARYEVGVKDWETYTRLRMAIPEKSKLKLDLMLTLGKDLPPEIELNRWIAERIDYVTIFSDCFVTNQKGHPVLSTVHSNIVKKLITYKAKVNIQEVKPEENLQPYYKFIQFMFEKMNEPTDKLFDAMKMYDIMQQPLQPYYDNLQSSTYCVFQKDNAKYDQYQLALVKALNTFPVDKKITIYYIGSGRGQLIYSSMNASKKANRKIFIYAIEKNPYPLQSLKRRIAKNKWEQHVEIVAMDIKLWQPTNKADIFLSELLGGFGDNELSPQCLYWAEKHLQKDTICIPYQYSAFCSPISCSSLYRQLKPQQKQSYFVCNLHNHYRPSTVQKLWTFTHPITSPQQFLKSSSVTFKLQQTTLLHGFAGYFDCDLYTGCRLSTNPQDHTPDMYSWFPMYFAFKEPLLVDREEQIKINVWRCGEKNKVWYEWQAEVGKQGQTKKITVVHNMNGKVNAIGK